MHIAPIMDSDRLSRDQFAAFEIKSISVQINLGALTNAPIKRYPSVYTYGSTSLGSRILNHGWHPQTVGNPV